MPYDNSFDTYAPYGYKPGPYTYAQRATPTPAQTYAPTSQTPAGPGFDDQRKKEIADAYRKYLGRDIRDYEYGFWMGNANFDRDISQSAEAKQYASSGQGGNYFNPGAVPEGFDTTKWNDPTHQSPKYIAGHILAAGGSIQQAAAAIGATVIDATRMRLPSGEVIDTRRDVEGANALQWLVLGNGANAGNGWTAPAGAGGAGGAGGVGGSAFSDPATSQWEQLIRDLVAHLNTPVPASQLELQQTQALDPLERQRQQRKQQEQLRLANRGITPDSGIYDEAMRDIDNQFEQLRTRTQAGFASDAAQNTERRMMDAVNLFKQIPQYQDSRLQLALSTMLPTNLSGLLNTQQGYQQMAQGQSNYNNAQNQQFYEWLGTVMSQYF